MSTGLKTRHYGMRSKSLWTNPEISSLATEAVKKKHNLCGTFRSDPQGVPPQSQSIISVRVTSRG